MTQLDDLVSIAKRHVEEGRRIVHLQHERVAKMGDPDAKKLLDTFEQCLVIFEQDLERLLNQRNRKS